MTALCDIQRTVTTRSDTTYKFKYLVAYQHRFFSPRSHPDDSRRTPPRICVIDVAVLVNGERKIGTHDECRFRTFRCEPAKPFAKVLLGIGKIACFINGHPMEFRGGQVS